jgi:hypothetical protein
MYPAPDSDPSSSSKNSKKNLYLNCSVPFMTYLSLKIDVNIPQKSYKQKQIEKNYFCWRLDGH